MSIASTIGKVVSSAVKAYTSAKKNNNSSSSSSSKSSSSNKTSSYVAKGNNTDDYIKQSNSNDYNAIQAYKQAYADAQARGDTQGMADANAGANAIRANYGYSGGSDGSEYIVTARPKEEENPYEDAMEDMQDKYDALAKQQQEANRLAVNQGVQRLENQKTTVNQSFDDSARQAYIANMQTKKNLPQQLAASGINGGAAETTNLGVQTAYENNLNNINMNRNNSINDIDNAIIELKNNGDLAAVEQALASSQAALDSYKTLLGSKINYDINKKENDFNTQLSTLGQYSDDYQAEIDRRTAINPNDPLIPYLIAARQEKINNQKLAEQESANSTVEQQRELAWNLFQETGIANDYIEAVLGIPAGTTTMDYTKNQYDINKPYYKPSTGNGNGTELYSVGDVIDLISKTGADAKTTIDALFNNYQIDEATLNTLYSLHGLSLDDRTAEQKMYDTMKNAQQAYRIDTQGNLVPLR